MAVSKKIISKKPIKKEETKEYSKAPASSVEKKRTSTEEQKPTKKTCFFCKSKTLPSYTDTSILRKFINDRVKIVPKMRTGVCSKHQRRVSVQIKYARHLAILPFVPKV